MSQLTETILRQWRDARDELEDVKARELEMRKAILSTFAPDGKARKIKINLDGHMLEFKLEPKMTTAVMSDFGEEDREQLSPAARSVFRHKDAWSIDKRRYDALPAIDRKAVDHYLITKPALGTISIK